MQSFLITFVRLLCDVNVLLLKHHNDRLTTTLVQNCCKGDSPCQWNSLTFRPLWIENPWTDRH